MTTGATRGLAAALHALSAKEKHLWDGPDQPRLRTVVVAAR